METWKRIYEIEELKNKLIGKLFSLTSWIESKNEVLDMVASDVVKSSNPNLEKVKSQTGPTSSLIEN